MREKILKQGHWYIVGLLLIGVIFIWQKELYVESHTHLLTASIFKEGSSVAVYIEGPNGTQVLVNAGNIDGAFLKGLPRAMPFGDRTFDMAILTSFKQSDFGGFFEIFKHYSVDRFIVPGGKTTHSLYQELQSELTSKQSETIALLAPQNFSLGGGATLDIKPEGKATGLGIVLRYGATSLSIPEDALMLATQYGNTTLYRSDSLHTSARAF